MRAARVFWPTALLLLSSFAVASAGGCSDPPPASSDPAPVVCLDAGIDESCTPAYEPTFDALYANTFQRSCASPGVSCHAETGKQGGVDFSAPEAAYAALTKNKLHAGDPACSVLVQRVVSTDGKTRMPPGRSLSAGEQCAVIQWVAKGAPR
jgi:Planctomycete cytochrome C